LTDFKGDKTDEVRRKMTELFGVEIFEKERNGLSHEIDLYSKRTSEKIRHL